MSVSLRFIAFVSVSSAALGQTAPVATPQPVAPAAATTAPGAATPAATTVEAVKVAAPATGSAILPANTDIMLRLDEEVSSKRVKTGHKFRLSVIQDVMLGNYVVIPRGTPASGEVTYRTGKGAFGKSAKMEIDVRSVQLNGRSIPVVGHFRMEGQGNTGATVGAAVAVGVFSAFVTGRSAVFAEGRELRVSTKEPLPVTLPN